MMDDGESGLCVRGKNWVAGNSVQTAHLFGEVLSVLWAECPDVRLIGAPPNAEA